MQLHILHGSPNCHKVLATAAHLGVELEISKLELFGPEIKSPEYLQLNPNGKTPVLIDGDLSLWESNAICIYLATRGDSDQSLFVSASRPKILQWLFWEASHYNASFGTIVWEAVVKPAMFNQEPNTPLLEDAMDNFRKYAAVLDQHLASNKFVVGTDWTLADYCVGSLEKFMEVIPLSFASYPNIQDYYSRLRENPHWAATRVGLSQLTDAA